MLIMIQYNNSLYSFNGLTLDGQLTYLNCCLWPIVWPLYLIVSLSTYISWWCRSGISNNYEFSLGTYLKQQIPHQVGPIKLLWVTISGPKQMRVLRQPLWQLVVSEFDHFWPKSLQFPNQISDIQFETCSQCPVFCRSSSYGCACFSGFSGSDCGHGPLCEDVHTNVCQNGGTCK